MKNTNKNISTIKEYYKKLKIAWENPKKRAGIKLLSYFIFFFIFFLIVSIANNIDNNKKIDYNKQTTTTIKVDKYTNKQTELLTTKHNINYRININNNEYIISGTLENNIINGFLEMEDGIKKIIIENNIIYEVKNEEKVLIDNIIDCNLINLNSIINTIKQNKSIIETTKDNNKKYSYKINDIDKTTTITIYTNEKSIYKIEVNRNTEEYVLNFDI